MLTMTMIIFLVKFNILSNISYIITIADMTTKYMSLIIIIITFKPWNNQTILLRNSMQFLILVLMIIGLIILAVGCETNLIIRFTTSTGRLLIYILVYTISLEVTLPLMVKIDWLLTMMITRWYRHVSLQFQIADIGYPTLDIRLWW